MKINIREEFGYAPGPRYIREGDLSAELFRREFLLPAMKKAIQEKVILTVDVDGTAGFGKSFFEESFGGLIREEGLDYKDIVDHLEVISNEEVIHKEKIYFHLKKAHAEKKK
jgi:hypothetical protein